MKRKYLIIISSIIFLITISFIGIFTYQKYEQNKKEKEQTKLINNTKSKYEFYLNNEIKPTSSDKTTKFFTKILEEEKKNEEIDLTKINKDITNIDESVNKIDEEINNYNLDNLDNLKEKDLLLTIDKNVDKKTLIDIYKQNNLIKNLDKEIEKRKEYLTNLETLKNELVDIKNNSQDFYLENNIYICKNDDILNKLNNYSQKYNLNLNIQKEKIVIPPEEKTLLVPILCYHGVLDNPWGIENLFVRVQEFEEQMKYLSTHGYTPIFTTEIKNADNYNNPIIITFDDGYKDVYTNAFPILKKYNIKANIYLISGWLNGDVYMNDDEVKEMAASPLIEIGSHTVTHQALAKLSNERIEEEVKLSQEQLRNLTGKSIDVIAYPTGSYDARVIDIVKKYYKYGLSTIKGKEDPHNLNTYTLKRIYVYRGVNVNSFASLF